MGREFELKYRASEGQLDALEDRFGPFAAISMQTCYYDTPGRDLGARRWTLRLRLENGESLCTVKTPAADGSRGEWEVRCGNIAEAIPLLAAMGAPAELAELTAAGLQQVCGARFTRLAALLPTEGGSVELALDRGVLLGGGREQPFAEVEVEHKTGSEEQTLRFAQSLAAEYGLQTEPRSKVQRALALAKAQR